MIGSIPNHQSAPVTTSTRSSTESRESAKPTVPATASHPRSRQVIGPEPPPTSLATGPPGRAARTCGTSAVRVLAPLTRGVRITRIDVVAARHRGEAMSHRNALTQVPIRAARWSATHPWRAILAWLAFVLVAVGLAVAVPTAQTKDAD